MNYDSFGASPRLRFGVLLLFSVLAVAGCGKRVAEVSGTVKYRGNDLPSGNVTFFNGEKQIVGSSAITDGKYKVAQVPPGSVIITVTTPAAANRTPHQGPAPAKDMPAPVAATAIPTQYGNPEQSRLTYDVKPGSQVHPIELN